MTDLVFDADHFTVHSHHPGEHTERELTSVERAIQAIKEHQENIRAIDKLLAQINPLFKELSRGQAKS